MADRVPIAIPVPVGQREKKPEDDKPKIGVKKPKKKTDLMDLDIKKRKEEGDFSELVNKAIPEQVTLAKSGKVSEAIENLYALEKQCRNGGDAFSTAKVVTCIVELLWEANDFKGLIENLQMLSKKRGQLKQAVTSMVQKAVTFVDRLSIEKELDKKLELIDTLRTISEGKIYVENERARLTMILAKIRESQGKIKEAADIMQEVQVETYGAMEKREKTEFILEQVRLCLDSGDFIRAQIISRKINTRVLSDAGFEDLKLTYYTLMVRYWTNQGDYLEIAKAYQAMYDTPKVKENADLWKKHLKLLVLFLTLSPFNNEQSDFINRVQADKLLEELPLEQNLVRLFLTKELMAWPKLEQLYKSEFSPLGEKAWKDFHNRVVEHNIRVIAAYYTRISMTRLSQLLYLTAAETEKFVSDQVVSKGIFARIDRPRGVINFVKRQEPAEVMDEWAHNVGELLELVEKTCHLIARENMVHAAAEKAAATKSA